MIYDLSLPPFPVLIETANAAWGRGVSWRDRKMA